MKRKKEMRKSWHLNLLLAHSVVPPCVVVGSVLDKKIKMWQNDQNVSELSECGQKKIKMWPNDQNVDKQSKCVRIVNWSPPSQ